MYKRPSFRKTSITNSSIEVGQMIHDKVKAVIEQGESLQEAPLIYTDKADGIMAGYNIRTDKWEIAIEAMDKINKVRAAQGEAKRGKMVDMKTDNTTDSAGKSEGNGDSGESK